MTAAELLRAGRLSDARSHLVNTIKERPGDTSSRNLLFQVLAFLGEWDKALRQLDILGLQHPGPESAVNLYGKLVAAENERSLVFAGERIPSFMTTEPPFLQASFNFRECLSSGQIDEALELFDTIETMVPDVTGRMDGAEFNGFCNTDVSLAHYLEVFIHERYLWVPFTSLRELCVNRPVTFLDLLWIPARIVTWEGLTSNCYLPVLYPDSSSHPDERVRMGKMTDWRDNGGGLYRGFGQQVFNVGNKEIAILELNEITFTTGFSGAGS